MASNSAPTSGDGTYYVRGSGWVSISGARTREIHNIIQEFHQQESDTALVLMRHRIMV
ncbi:MAG TPA: hypothetical protein VLY21_05970 [Nitrososphaerales archaeon]|nr:hypothetical protein [Nitrososphaerales archaeon]